MTMETLTAILGWSSIINFAVLTLSFLVIKLWPALLSNFQAKLLGIDAEDLRLMYIKWLGAYKIGIILFNLVPYIALRIVV